MRERERIRPRAGRQQEHGDLVLEDFGQTLLDPLGPLVIAVAERIAGVRLAERIEDFGRHAGRVVACEVHRSTEPQIIIARWRASAALYQRLNLQLNYTKTARNSLFRGTGMLNTIFDQI